MGRVGGDGGGPFGHRQPERGLGVTHRELGLAGISAGRLHRRLLTGGPDVGGLQGEPGRGVLQHDQLLSLADGVPGVHPDLADAVHAVGLNGDVDR